MDHLKTTEGSSLSINTLIDMAAQARRLSPLLFYFLFPQRDPPGQEGGTADVCKTGFWEFRAPVSSFANAGVPRPSQ